MINAEKILGAMLKRGLRSGGRRRRSGGLSSVLSGGMKGTVGLGLLGVAMAAFEHFTEDKPGQAATSFVPPPPPGSRPTPPPPPPASEGEFSSSAGEPTHEPGSEESLRGALLLIRVMIAAANCDGLIDENEKSRIVGELKDAGLNLDEAGFLERELNDPPSIDSLLNSVVTSEQAQQVYAASFLAIELDSQAERDYLNYVRMRLGLDEQTARAIEARLGGVEEGS